MNGEQGAKQKVKRLLSMFKKWIILIGCLKTKWIKIGGKMV
jgi:hypothetical protein